MLTKEINNRNQQSKAANCSVKWFWNLCTAYVARHDPERSNVFSLVAPIAANFKNARIDPKRDLDEIKLELNFCGRYTTITGVGQSAIGNKYDMKFYYQQGAILTGEMCRSGRAVICALAGDADENGVIIPLYVFIRVLPTKLDKMRLDHRSELDPWLNAVKIKNSLTTVAN